MEEIRKAPAIPKRPGLDKTAQNIQEAFLNNARKEKIFLTIYLMSGVKLSGRIKSFDKYSVILETNNQEQLCLTRSNPSFSPRNFLKMISAAASVNTGMGINRLIMSFTFIAMPGSRGRRRKNCTKSSSHNMAASPGRCAAMMTAARCRRCICSPAWVFIPLLNERLLCTARRKSPRP